MNEQGAKVTSGIATPSRQALASDGGGLNLDTEDRWLWTTKAELISLLSLRPDLQGWDALKTFFLSDQDRPIPLWQILERTNVWVALSVCAAPAHAGADVDGSLFSRLKAFEAFVALVAKSICLAIPVPYRPEGAQPSEWFVRWVRLQDIFGKDAAEVIARLWDQVEGNSYQTIAPADWYEELAAAIPLEFVVGITRHLTSGPTDVVRAIVEAITNTSPDTVARLIVVFRAIAWQYALRESGLAEMSRAQDLSISSSPSCEILRTIDAEYERLLDGLMLWGGEFVAKLPTSKE